MSTDIETLKQMTIGEIKQLEKSWKIIVDVIDQKKELVRYLENGTI